MKFIQAWKPEITSIDDMFFLTTKKQNELKAEAEELATQTNGGNIEIVNPLLDQEIGTIKVLPNEMSEPSVLLKIENHTSMPPGTAHKDFTTRTTPHQHVIN